MIWFALGILLGGAMGILLMGILTANRRSDSAYKIYYEKTDVFAEDIKNS